MTFHPDRDYCECERLGRDQSATCIYPSPCWISKEHYEQHEEAMRKLREAAERAIDT